MKKISDNMLLQAIWVSQLHQLSYGVLHRYVRHEYGVCNKSEYVNSSDIHIQKCQSISPLLCKQQLLKRIKQLIKDKRLDWAFNQLTFFINTNQAKEAFLTSRNFWLAHGVPVAIKNNKSFHVYIDDHSILVDHCFTHLQKKFNTLSLDKAITKKGIYDHAISTF